MKRKKEKIMENMGVIGDVNMDSRKDVIYEKEDVYNHGIYVRLSSKGSFRKPKSLTLKILELESEISDLCVRDLDGDNILDITYIVFPSSSEKGKWVRYFLKGNGNGTFQEPKAIISV